MKQCPYCAEQIQDEAIKCRFCGEMVALKQETPITLPPAAEENILTKQYGLKLSKEKEKNVINFPVLAIFIIAGVFIWRMSGSWSDLAPNLEEPVHLKANQEMQRIENQVAEDAVTQYGIAKRNGTAMDICVQAGFVAAAYLQAKDEPNYQHWKEIEKTDCAAAGLQK